MGELMHTPGPWTISEDSWNEGSLDVGGVYQYPLATVVVTLDGGIHPVSIANAKLIAAAPELLAALMEIVKKAEFSDNYATVNVASPIIFNAICIIAKATGDKK